VTLGAIACDVQEFRGKVVKKHIASGSKSERDAVCLESEGHAFVLRRQHGNPFYDQELEKLVGKRLVHLVT
jgi:hypothetical protein